ncbi:anion permease [Microbacterium sp. cx-55]|uniref:SLC13 family permease n=1 Tax=Microbacterium sp. cx-55 TaxID=2875948 RepID=UPI001CBFF409|nr:SLC13 family permease [Microbacterium sp. cx-55]MBZ4488265.1 anion permease [Microbacterium sp. cx-55]UGB34926.1 anion permease [Microbacterium sp. cx-55]
MDPIIVTFVVLGVAVVAFVSGKVPLEVVSLGVLLSLWVTGVLTLPEALAGFSDPTVLFIATLFVVSESLDATGVTAWLAQRIVPLAGTRPARLIAIVSACAAVLAAFISINGAVAALLPVVVVVAVRANLVPSKLLIPFAFAASAGSLLTLAGTPVNPVVSELAVSAGGTAFGFFEFALVGAPLVVLTVLLVTVLGPRLLPERIPVQLGDAAPDIRDAARAFRRDYDISATTSALLSAEQGVVEVLVAPHSSLIGRDVCAGMTTRAGSLVILGVRRGADAETDAARPGEMTRLRAGDAVLVQGPWASLDRYVRSPDVIAVTSPHLLRRAVPLGRGAKRALVILALTVALLASGVVPPAVVGLLAAAALVVTRALPVAQAYRAISWTTVILIAGMIPLSQAFVSTGAADVVADAVLRIGGTGSPYVALLVVCLVTLVLGQFISNVATVLVVAPIAVSISASLGVSVQPFMMALTVAGAAAFLTPIATPVNLMVMQPGGYRFGDYWRLGLPLALVFLAVAVLYVPLVWPF